MYKDFRKYAMSQKLSGSVLDDMFKVSNSTPAIFEEADMKGHVMSVFDRLMKDRIIFINGEVNDQMAETVKAQIMYLDTISNEPINEIIHSGGGSVVSGRIMLCANDLSKSIIKTTCQGYSCSMGAVLLGAGEKGHRSITKNSLVMLHQIAFSVNGNIQDIDIQAEQGEQTNEILFSYLAEYCGKTPEQVKKDATRDFWMNSVDSLIYGIVDQILWDKDTIITLDNLDIIKEHIIYKQSKIGKPKTILIEGVEYSLDEVKKKMKIK